MIPTRWNRYQWETTTLVDFPPLKNPFSVRSASPEEKEEVTYVALRSLQMNTEWNDDVVSATNFIKKGIEIAFKSESNPAAVVIAHGQRLIGVSLFDARLEAPFHLVSGPWVLMEYRNRGLGSALLHATLAGLSERGITTVSGVTRAKTVAARYIYPKFGSIRSDYDLPEETKDK